MNVYEPVAYWRERGRIYERDFVPGRYRRQEDAIAALLDGLEFETVLDVGCGFGRIGELVWRLRPDISRYVGLDISEDQLAAARRRVPAGEFRIADVRHLEGIEPADLVVASEILMHIPPGNVAAVAAALRGLALRHLVTVDWDAPGQEAGNYCFGHDYAALFPGAVRIPVDRQAIWHLAS